MVGNTEARMRWAKYMKPGSDYIQVECLNKHGKIDVYNAKNSGDGIFDLISDGMQVRRIIGTFSYADGNPPERCTVLEALMVVRQYLGDDHFSMVHHALKNTGYKVTNREKIRTATNVLARLMEELQ